MGAFGSVAILAFLLNLILQEWVSAVNLAVVIVFTSITLMLAAHSLVLAIRDRVSRNRDDPRGHQVHFDLVA
jgi:high-affinity Fe2+/Pb2+ permease